MAGVLRARATPSTQKIPRLNRRRRRRSAQPAESQLYLQSAPSKTSLPALQRACGNQAVCQMLQAQMEEDKPARKPPGAGNLTKSPQPLRLVYWGETARPVPSLEQDRHLRDARKNGMAEVLAWEERGSGRLLRTCEHSGAFYKWLGNRIDKHPGMLELGENQYWAIDPKRGRVWLCTLHVLPAEEESREERARERGAARTAELSAAARAGTAGSAGTSSAFANAISLLPMYLGWLSSGGSKNDPQLMIPASWYLRYTDPGKWNLVEFLGMRNFARLMGEQSYQHSVNSILFGTIARDLGKATGQKVQSLAGREMEFLQTMQKGMEQSGMPPIQIRMTIEAFQMSVLLRKIPKFNEALQSGDPNTILIQTNGIMESASALMSYQFAGLAELIKGGKDDSGFFAACARTELQKLYYVKKLMGHPAELGQFLLEMNIKDKDVFQALRRILQTMTGTSIPVMTKT